MYKFTSWSGVVITILIIIVQRFIMPKLKFRFGIYILPIVSFITGIAFIIFSQNSLLTKAIMVAVCAVLSVVILLMGGDALSERRKKNQEQYSKNEFYKKK